MTTIAKNERYAALEQKIETLMLSSNRYSAENLVKVVKECRAKSIRNKVPLAHVLYDALYLKDDKSKEDLEGVLETLDRIEKGWYKTKGDIPHIPMHKVYEKGSAAIEREFKTAMAAWVEEIAAFTKEIAGDTDFPTNVKKIIVHPLMTLMFEELKNRELDFFKRFNDAVERKGPAWTDALRK